jgi:hypothetical protein
MSSRRILLVLLVTSGALLAGIALLIRTDSPPSEVAAASPGPDGRARAALDLDAAPDAVLHARSEVTGRRVACRGRVFGDFDEGVEGVPVELGIEAADGGRILAHSASGSRGRFLCEVDVPLELAGAKDTFLFARIERDGYPRRIVRRPIESLKHGVDFHLSLALLRVLPGTVVDADGLPVDRALVELRTDDLPGVDGSAWTKADGSFEMIWSRPGSFRLSAKAQGKGSTRIAPIVLDAQEDPEPLRIVLERSDVLEGRVEDTEGHPIPAEELWAFPASLAGSSAESLFAWRMTSRSDEPDGTRSGSTTSTQDGSFRFTGLAPGTYFVAPRTELDETTFAARVWRAGDRDVRVVLERWWLELRGPPSGAGRLFCAGLYEGRAGGALPIAEPGATLGSVVFAVEGGRSYVYGCVDAQHEVVEARVLIPWDRPRTVCEIPDAPRVESGSLRITLMTLDRDDARRQRTVRIRSATTGFELWRWNQRGEDLQSLLAPGSYVLHVSLEPTRSFRDGSPGFEALLVDERSIEIRPAETTRVDLWR